MSAAIYPPLLSVDAVCVSRANKAILQNVSFHLQAGEFVGLLGPNGAGKSTLLRCLYRYLQPDSGEICWQDQAIHTLSLKYYAQQVAVVLQEVSNDFNLALFDVVAMGLTPHKSLFATQSQADKSHIDAAIAAIGLSDKAQQSYNSLSGGERQRVMIAKAMVQSPQLLIMDEPTSHLDVKYQIQIMELAKSMGVTVLASFHDLNLAAAVCDRLLVMKSGKLVADGTPIAILDETLLSDVFAVCAEVTEVPCPMSKDKRIPHIRYFYGYQQ
ncbi:ABC transporter ATP-binding protein [Pseudoalteromonas fenneropenaei]|uniref:ABC transporter ATP-binding protein n=1 Tax=Pseudoalteromonas fenneropenaei TaxID=1737459 RepID=A0ABV7CLL4_9GAMM